MGGLRGALQLLILLMLLGASLPPLCGPWGYLDIAMKAERIQSGPEDRETVQEALWRLVDANSCVSAMDSAKAHLG